MKIELITKHLNDYYRGPRTLNGDKMVWSGGGIGGNVELQSHGVNFSFRKTVREVKFIGHPIIEVLRFFVCLSVKISIKGKICIGSRMVVGYFIIKYKGSSRIKLGDGFLRISKVTVHRLF